MSRMSSFETLWAARHGVPAETLVQYRFESKEGYRLPGMAAHFRTYCDTLDSVVIELPVLNPEMFGCNVIFGHEKARSEAEKAITAAGLRVAP